MTVSWALRGEGNASGASPGAYNVPRGGGGGAGGPGTGVGGSGIVFLRFVREGDV